MTVLPALTDAQWAMLQRLFHEPKVDRAGWVETKGYDNRTLNTLVRRGYVLRYPWNDRPFTCLTPSGRSVAATYGYWKRRQPQEEKSDE